MKRFSYRSPYSCSGAGNALLLFLCICVQGLHSVENYKSLDLADDAIYPVLEGVSNFVAVPCATSAHPELWVFSSTPYRLRPVGQDVVPNSYDQPQYPYDPGFKPIPLYGDPEPLPTIIGPGFHNLILREDGLFDLVHGGSLQYYRHTGSLDSPAFEVRETLVEGDPRQLESLSIKRHGEKFVGDVNSDGVPDLVFMHYDRSKYENPWLSRPGGLRPWELENLPEIGPSKDYEIMGPFRGNDIEGRSTAKPWTLELMWAPGHWHGSGQLKFAEPRPVYYGTSDYPVLWEQYQNRAYPRLIESDEGSYIALLEPMGRAFCLPILHADAVSLHLGKAETLLSDSADLSAMLKGGGTSGVIDVNGDGVDEFLVRGGAFGGVLVLAGERPGNYREVAVLRRTGAGAKVTGLEVSVSERVEMTGDSWPDLLIGTAPGSLFVFPGTDNPLVYEGPVFPKTPEGFIYTQRARSHTNLQGPQERSWGYLNPHAADFDGDGFIDLLLNDNTSWPILLRGTTEPLVYEKTEPFTYRGRTLQVQWRTKLAVVPAEWNFHKTERACVAYLDLDRGLSVGVPVSTGSTEIGEIIPLLTEAGNPLVLCGFNGQSGRTKISLHDWDEDGDWDLVFGTAGGLLSYFDSRMPYGFNEFREKFGFRLGAQPYVWINVGTSQFPVFEDSGPRRIGILNTDSPLDPGIFMAGYHCFSIDPTDLDGDGKLDFIAANEHGEVMYFYSHEFVTQGWE